MRDAVLLAVSPVTVVTPDETPRQQPEVIASVSTVLQQD
jgi:hypothetical protein